MRTLQHKVPKSTPTTAITNYFEDVMEDSKGVGGFVTSDVQGGKVGMLDVGQTSVFDAHFEGSFFFTHNRDAGVYRVFDKVLASSKTCLFQSIA